MKDSSRHVILGTQQFKPNEFASQINLSVENAWGILRCVIDICMKLEEGKYLILKDPNKQVIRVYSLPDGTFSSDEDDEDEEEEEEEEEGLYNSLPKVSSERQATRGPSCMATLLLNLEVKLLEGSLRHG